MNLTPLIQVVIFGGLPTMRARNSFHSPCFQNFGQSSSGIGKGTGVSTPWILDDLDAVGPVEEGEVAHVRLAAKALAVDPHQVAADVIVDHGLVALAVLGASGGTGRCPGRNRCSSPARPRSRRTARR